MEGPFYKTIITVESSDFESIIWKKQGRLIYCIVDCTIVTGPVFRHNVSTIRRNPATHCAASLPFNQFSAISGVAKFGLSSAARKWTNKRKSQDLGHFQEFQCFHLILSPCGFLDFKMVGCTWGNLWSLLLVKTLA